MVKCKLCFIAFYITTFLVQGAVEWTPTFLKVTLEGVAGKGGAGGGNGSGGSSSCQ